MSRPNLTSRFRTVAAFAGEFAFVIGVLFGSLGVAVVVLGGFDPMESGAALAFFGVVLLIAAIHHGWYARNRDEIESSPQQKALRERRGF